MRALTLGEAGAVFRADWPEPRPLAGEVLVHVLRAGICETDLQLIQGYKGFRGVLGHEFVGIAESGPFAGRRVVGEINCSCGACDTCLGGSPGHCPSRRVIGILDHDGAFADRIAIPQANLHLVPDEIATDAAVFVEPVAAAYEIPAQIRLNWHDRIVVLGDGRLGTLCAQVLAELCDRVLVVGKHPGKLRILASLGLSTCLLSEKPDDRCADVVVDCTGSASGFTTALELVRPRGTIVLKTTIAGRQSMEWAPVVVDEITIVGSRCGPFDRALKALAEDRILVDALVSERFDLGDGVRALERAADPGVLKVLLDVNGS
ncbi:MAG TPA: alcohol dehydrogenase catalytic domain-containing protein [Vicinamibacterales bacterium]|jgi:threonine dehydrogenase-like Zn-dependent dehydrogenase